MTQSNLKRIVSALAVGAAALVVSACGSGESSSGDSSAANACTSACSRCGGDLCADCAGTSDRYRAEYTTALYSCVNGSDGCSEATWSTCATQAAGSAPRRAADDTYRSACMAKRNDCASQGIDFADDYCLGSSLISDAWLQKANDCVTTGCADIATCLRPIFQ